MYFFFGFYFQRLNSINVFLTPLCYHSLMTILKELLKNVNGCKNIILPPNPNGMIFDKILMEIIVNIRS